jgi:hypothetical protein
MPGGIVAARSDHDGIVIAVIAVISGGIGSVIGGRIGIGIATISGGPAAAAGAGLVIVGLHDDGSRCITAVSATAGNGGSSAETNSEAKSEEQQSRNAAEIEHTQGHGLFSITQAASITPVNVLRYTSANSICSLP